MFRFLKKIALFSILFGSLYFVGMLLPATPKGANYYLFSKPWKDQMMKETEGKRIIFLGGSNLVFGINSNLIMDSLEYRPINAGLSATVGLKYMLDNASQYIHEGDLVVVSPEYQQFFGKFGLGQLDLVIMVSDVDHTAAGHLNQKQWINFVKKSPEYFFSKFNPNQYFGVDHESIYGMQIFNEFGDSDFHWDMQKRNFDPSSKFTGKVSPIIMNRLKKFNSEVESKGATMLITFPGYQDISFEKNQDQILILENELKEAKFNLLGDAERYKMNNEFMFETPYHMTKKGVDFRTQLLIEDIRSYLSDHNQEPRLSHLDN